VTLQPLLAQSGHPTPLWGKGQIRPYYTHTDHHAARSDRRDQDRDLEGV